MLYTHTELFSRMISTIFQKIYSWFSSLPLRTRDSIKYTLIIIGAVSTVLSVLGYSLGMCIQSFWLCIGVLVGACVILFLIIYWVIGSAFKTKITIRVGDIPVMIHYGDIFAEPGIRVIPCDCHYSLKIDDITINKRSLHGQLVEKHADNSELSREIKSEARNRNIQYRINEINDAFPSGSIVAYTNTTEKQTYFLLAVTKLDNDQRVYTDTAQFAKMLLKMWDEIDKQYAGYDIVLPIIGSGTLRFPEGERKDAQQLVKCMLCTLERSGVDIKSMVRIVVFDGGKTKKLSMYEFKDVNVFRCDRKCLKVN